MKRKEFIWTELFDMMADGISIHGADFTILNANRALCDMVGKAKKEIIGRKCYEVFHGQDAPLEGCVMEKSRMTGKHESIDLYEQRFGLWLSAISSPVFTEGGSERVVHILRNETCRKKAEEKRDRIIIDHMEILFALRRFQTFWPVCSSCKRLRNEKGEWEMMELFISDRTGAEFTHGLCPECSGVIYKELADMTRK